jgi:hypothetical protein
MKDAHKRYMNYKTNFILHLISINYFILYVLDSIKKKKKSHKEVRLVMVQTKAFIIQTSI